MCVILGRHLSLVRFSAASQSYLRYLLPEENRGAGTVHDVS